MTLNFQAQSACHQSDVEGGKDINSGRGISVSSESTCDRSKASQLAENLDLPAKPHQGSNPDSTGVPLGLGLGGLQPKVSVLLCSPPERSCLIVCICLLTVDQISISIINFCISVCTSL